MGRAAISAYLQAQIDDTGMQIDLQELGSVDLGDGWALLGSSWSGTEPGAESAATVGGSLGLLRQQDDGSWQIHWVVSNSWPATM